MGGKEKRKR